LPLGTKLQSISRSRASEQLLAVAASVNFGAKFVVDYVVTVGGVVLANDVFTTVVSIANVWLVDLALLQRGVELVLVLNLVDQTWRFLWKDRENDAGYPRTVFVGVSFLLSLVPRYFGLVPASAFVLVVVALLVGIDLFADGPAKRLRSRLGSALAVGYGAALSAIVFPVLEVLTVIGLLVPYLAVAVEVPSDRVPDTERRVYRLVDQFGVWGFVLLILTVFALLGTAVVVFVEASQL
jgi:hypothetical protein